jgi:hypothetical protein
MAIVVLVRRLRHKQYNYNKKQMHGKMIVCKDFLCKVHAKQK